MLYLNVHGNDYFYKLMKPKKVFNIAHYSPEKNNHLSPEKSKSSFDLHLQIEDGGPYFYQ